jgi:VWFA-related protein
MLIVSLPATAQQPADPSSADQAVTTIKANVRQVLLDVVVTDAKRHPVTGLRQQEFSLTEDGKAQPIAFFEAHSAAAALPPAALPVLPVNTFINLARTPQTLPLNVLLYDVLNTPIDDQPFAHKELVKFLQHKPAGSRFAIFVLSDRLRLLQGFTEDEQRLIAAVDHGAQSQRSTTYQTPEEEHGASSQLSDSGLLPANDPAAQAMLDRMQHMETVAGNYFLTQRVEKTVAAFADIAAFVNGLPGRKNLIWLSGSFPVGIFPGNDAIDAYGTAVSYSADLRRATDLLTVGEVAVYPVDIRGLTVNPVFGASSPRIYRSPAAFAAAHGQFGQQIDAEHASMDQIAGDSGGRAFYDTNGLQEAIAAGADEGANYYSLGYTPSNTRFDGSLRHIRVSLASKGYRLEYRRSYLADDSVLSERQQNAAPDHVKAVMRRGAPEAAELIFEAHVAPQGGPLALTPAQITQLSQFPAFASQKKWDEIRMQRYSIDYAMLGRQISFLLTPDAHHHAAIEFLFAAFDRDGNTMFGLRTADQEAFSEQDLEKLRKGAYRVRQTLDIPAAAAWLRLGVHDIIANRIGTIEIPLPLAAPAPQSNAN